MNMNMKSFYYLGIVILVILAGCNNFDSFVVTEKPYVNQKSVQLYIGEHAGDRNTIQLVSSPPDKGYTWTSLDPTVVTVDQNGLVKAVSEGITTIIVASKDDQTTIDVNVKEFVPLVDFKLSTSSVIGFWQNSTQIFVTYEPDNATEVDLEWISSNNKVAKVYKNGLIKTLEEGRATVTVKCGDIKKTVDVWVPAPPVKMDKSNWEIPGYNPNSNVGTIGYSSQQRSDGGGVPSIIDDNLDTYWHASYSSPVSNYPHWIIIDLGEEVTIAQVGMARRKGDGRGQKGYQIFTCTEDGATDLTNPNSWQWEDQGDFSLDANKDGIQTHSVLKFPVARYVKIYIAEKYRGSNNFAMIGDFSVYIFNE
jgi:hypothetical protein